MASQTYVDSVTLTAATEFNRFDTAAYPALGSVAGTNTITATGPANLGLVATNPPLWFIPAGTNTGATTLNITPSGGAALGAKNVFSGGAACVGGEIVSGVPCAVVYDGTQYNLLVAIGGVNSGSKNNLLINGAFNVAQRGTSFTSATTPANSDDTYLLDRWVLLSDGNDIVDVTQNTATVPTGSLYSCAFDVETANKKFGIIQFIEQKNAQRLIGGTATLSFKARKGASNSTVETMRAVVLAWDGTADAVTSDVVSAWGASGTNPTLVANWTAENVAADLTLTDTFQTFSITGISIDTSSTKNIAVFLYYNNADGTVGDLIYVTDVQLEPGSVATVFEQRQYGDELALCRRYYEVGGDGSKTTADQEFRACYSGGSSWPVRFQVPKRIPGSINLYAQGSGTGAKWRDQSVGSDVSATVTTQTVSGFISQATTVDTTSYGFTWDASAEL